MLLNFRQSKRSLRQNILIKIKSFLLVGADYHFVYVKNKMNHNQVIKKANSVLLIESKTGFCLLMIKLNFIGLDILIIELV